MVCRSVMRFHMKAEIVVIVAISEVKAIMRLGFDLMCLNIVMARIMKRTIRDARFSVAMRPMVWISEKSSQIGLFFRR